jgi:hypothetical protein
MAGKRRLSGRLFLLLLVWRVGWVWFTPSALPGISPTGGEIDSWQPLDYL